MLNKNQVSRLYKISHIKSHPWFNNFSWNSLCSIEMQAPYVPKIRIKDEEYQKIPYLTYLKSCKENVSEKPNVDKKTQKQYDDWFKKF